ncbi:MAG TPA: M56 family metallopeptidase [Isosphaeraceae bacterium]|nr:M56 family metallopeptidase [Isosphaeraceae bacterium]
MNPTSMTASPVWTAAGWTMLHLWWVGATLGLAAAISRRLARSARSETRYALALVCLGSLAIAAVVIFVWVFEPARGSSLISVCAGGGDTSAMAVAPMARMPASEVPERMSSPDRPTEPHRRSVRARLDGLAAGLPWLWLAGTPLNLVLLATGLVGVERIRRSSRFVESGEIPRCCRVLADSLGIACRIGVAVCDRVAAPILIGVVRPLILLPPAAITSWSVEEIEMALLHELAHLKRWDNLVNLSQRLVESLLFFHPVAWWLSGWVRLERELCCDRLVVARLGRPEAYVEMLVAVAAARRAGRPVAPATAMADRQLSTRIRRIFSLEDRSMKLTMPEGIGLVGALLAGIALALGTHAAPPKPAGESQESLRLSLQQAAKDVLADPRPGAEGGGLKFLALVSVGEAQLKLGDRAEALETLRRASEACERFDFKKYDWGDLEVFAILPEIAKRQREAGDFAAARVSLDRAMKLVESLQGFTKVQELIQITGAESPRREKHEVGPLIRCGLLEMIALERIALGDRDEARPLLQQSVAAIQAQKDELKPVALAGLAPKLFKAGEEVFWRAVALRAPGDDPRTDFGHPEPPMVAEAMLLSRYDRRVAATLFQPVAAFERSRPLRDTNDITSSILLAWVCLDPRQAVAVVESLPPARTLKIGEPANWRGIPRLKSWPCPPSGDGCASGDTTPAAASPCSRRTIGICRVTSVYHIITINMIMLSMHSSV